MKKRAVHFLAAAVSMFAFLMTAQSWAAEESAPNVTEILKKTKEVFEPSSPSLRKIVITLQSEGKPAIKWIGAQAIKKLPDGKRMLFVMLEPDDMKGTAYLVHEQENGPDKMFLYVPAIRRVREIKSETQYDRFLGTDYTYFDLGFLRLHDNYQFLGEEDRGSTPAYKLEEKIQLPRSFYSEIVLWIDKKSLLPLERDYYDNGERLWKVETFEEVAVVSGVPTPMRITMKDVQNNTATELRLSEVQYCGELDNILFNIGNLAEAASHPIWQPYCTFPMKKENKTE